MGDHTKIIQVEASTDARLDLLEEDSRDHNRRIGALEARTGDSSSTLWDWVRLNGKWLIAAVVALAAMGWTASDIRSLLS